MFINSIKLQNFRCFESKRFTFDKKFIVIEGNNGTGKTSILEAIYYTCYFRSFRTRLNRELVSFDSKHFFLQTDFEESSGLQNKIQIGYSEKDGKLVKFNQKQVQSYKDIIFSYRVISISEDDIQLISGAPEYRRAFLNQSLFLLDPKFASSLKLYKQVLEQRNSFISKNCFQTLNKDLEKELYAWTKQLWEQSIFLQKVRISLLKDIESKVNSFLIKYFSEMEEISIKLEYKSKNLSLKQNFEQFWQDYKDKLLKKELQWTRTLFGAHLDDFSIFFQKRQAKHYASRGQQKLVLFILKIVQLLVLQYKGESGCLLLDDFLTDFDQTRVQNCLRLLKELDCQLFITCPIKSFIFNVLSDSIEPYDLQIICL